MVITFIAETNTNNSSNQPTEQLLLLVVQCFLFFFMFLFCFLSVLFSVCFLFCLCNLVAGTMTGILCCLLLMQYFFYCCCCCLLLLTLFSYCQLFFVVVVDCCCFACSKTINEGMKRPLKGPVYRQKRNLLYSKICLLIQNFNISLIAGSLRERRVLSLLLLRHFSIWFGTLVPFLLNVVTLLKVQY